MSVNLPPLPPIGGQTTGRSVADVLAEQHRDLLDLCRRLSEGDRGRVAQVVSATLSKHLSGEQQYLYPAVRQAVPGGEPIVDRELAADRDLLTILRRLDTTEPADPDFGRLAAEVTRAVRRHVAAGTDELLPLLAQMVPVEDLIRIGNRLETAEEAAPTRPHPATPFTPPWNKVVEPLVAVADKARDALSGRVTRPQDL